MTGTQPRLCVTVEGGGIHLPLRTQATGGGSVLLPAAALETTASLFPCQMWCDQLGGTWQIFPTFCLFLFSHFTAGFFFHFLSSFLSCFFLPSCLCAADKGRLVLSMGREGYLQPSMPMLALWVPWHRGLLEACDKHLPTFRASHHTALHPLRHRACQDPTWQAAGALIWGWGGLDKERAQLTMTLIVREGRKLFFFIDILTSLDLNSLYNG